MHWRLFRRDESGAELVEFALCSVVLLTVLFGVVDVSRMLYLDHYVGQAARIGSRYAMVRGSTWAGTACASASSYQCMASSANVQNYILHTSPAGMPSTPLSATTTWPGTSASGGVCDTSSGSNSPGCIVTVKVQYGFTFLVPFIPHTASVVTSTSSITIAQ